MLKGAILRDKEVEYSCHNCCCDDCYYWYPRIPAIWILYAHQTVWEGKHGETWSEVTVIGCVGVESFILKVVVSHHIGALWVCLSFSYWFVLDSFVLDLFGFSRVFVGLDFCGLVLLSFGFDLFYLVLIHGHIFSISFVGWEIELLEWFSSWNMDHLSNHCVFLLLWACFFLLCAFHCRLLVAWPCHEILFGLAVVSGVASWFFYLLFWRWLMTCVMDDPQVVR